MIRAYQKSDFEEVSSWFHKRNIPITESYLPKHGFISPGIAAGFIYSTDANFCIFECFISNPNTEENTRDMELKKIVTAMIQQAKELGFEEAYGFATSQGMIRRGAEQGFKFVETTSTIHRNLR